jgi:hypothetical protein
MGSQNNFLLFNRLLENTPLAATRSMTASSRRMDVLQIVPKDGEEFLVIRLCSNAEEIVDELPLAHDISLFCSHRI